MVKEAIFAHDVNTGDKMLDKYIVALDRLKTICVNNIPILQGEFIKERKLNAQFFTFAIKCKIIEKTMDEGKLSIFNWIYVKSDNETNTVLPMKLISIIRDQNIKYAKEAKRRKNNDKFATFKITNRLTEIPTLEDIEEAAKTAIPIKLESKKDKKEAISVKDMMLTIIDTYEVKIKNEEAEYEALYNRLGELDLSLKNAKQFLETSKKQLELI